MKFDASSLQKHQTGHFGFSAVPLDKLGSSVYCLATIIIDCSGSVMDFASQIEMALKEIVKGCKHSDYKDTFLLRVITFNDDHVEVHGFRVLMEIDPNEYTGIIKPYGMTALYDATVDGLEAEAAFGKTLIDQDYTVNGVLVLITDGMNNRGKIQTIAPCKSAMHECITGEKLESLLSILVGVVNPQSPDYVMVSQYLQDFKEQAGFTQYAELLDVSEKGFAKLANFVSESMSSQSKQAGSGGPSQPVEADF
jgi:hypothetical protein